MLYEVITNSVWNSLNSWALSALPLFVLMGEILYRTAISKKLMSGLAPWLSWIPGRLLHVNVVACSLFAAIVITSYSIHYTKLYEFSP